MDEKLANQDKRY